VISVLCLIFAIVNYLSFNYLIVAFIINAFRLSVNYFYSLFAFLDYQGVTPAYYLCHRKTVKTSPAIVFAVCEFGDLCYCASEISID